MKVAVLVTTPIEQDDNQPVQEVDYRRNVAKYDQSGGHTYDTIRLTKTNAKKILDNLVRKGDYDVFINLCDDDYNRESKLISENVVKFLHENRVAYTGADSTFSTLPERCIKIAASNSEIPIPDYEYVRTAEDFRMRMTRLQEIPAPWIVKTTTESRDFEGSNWKVKVSNFHELERQVQLMTNINSDAVVVVEEFIQGPQYTVLVVENPDDYAEPLTLTPMLYVFPDDHRDSFDFASNLAPNSIFYEPVADQEINDRLKDYSRNFFKMCIGNGYATCDFRMNIKTGELTFMGINTKSAIFYENPGYYTSIDQILCIDPLGHEGFLKLIIECAFKRQKRLKQNFEVDYHPKKGFFVKAIKDMEIGEIICDKEPRSVPLLSKKYVDSSWSKDPTLMRCFQEYCYQCGPLLYRTWEMDPKEWKPINHSCDPNSWMDGLAIVARRPIGKGDEITIDYSTYAYKDLTDDESSNEFECNCQTKECRKIIRPGRDYRQPGIVNKYRGHFSNFVGDLVDREMTNSHENPLI